MECLTLVNVLKSTFIATLTLFQVSLMGPATAFVNATMDKVTEWREAGTYPGYVMHQLSILPIQGSIRQHRSAVLLYWTYLHQLLHDCNKQTNDSSLLADVPAVIRRTLFDRFTQVAPTKLRLGWPLTWKSQGIWSGKSQGK